MAIQLMGLPQLRIQEQGLDAAPLTRAIQGYTAGSDAATQFANTKAVGQTAATGDLRAAAKQAMGLGETDLGMQYQQRATQDEAVLKKRLGSMAQAVEMEQDPARRQAMWQRVLKAVPGGAANLAPEEMDPMTGPKMLMAEAGIVVDPLERQQKQGAIGLQRAHADLYTAQAAAMRQKASGAGGQFENPKQRAEVEEGLRKEYASLAKPYFEVRDAYSRIEQSAKAPSAAGDMALIFNFMKMLDPGSVVREGEFATAQNAAGVPERIRAAWNRTVNGERLTPETRSDFTTQAKGLFDRQERQYMAIQDQYRGIASRTGVDPANTILDFSRATTDLPPAPQQRSSPYRAKNAQGQVIESDDGVNWRPAR